MEIDNRYWAGLFDGEGSIYIAKDLIHWRVTLTQKELPILYLFKNRFGGGITKYGKQTCHRLCLNSIAEMTAFLEAIVPYAIIKAIEIRVMLEFLNGCKKGDYNRGYNGGKSLKKEEVERRLSLREQMMTDRRDTKQRMS